MNGTEVRVLEMDRQELVQIMKCRGVERLHYFADGRKAVIRSRQPRPDVEVYVIALENMLTGFVWENGVGYHNLDECERTARQMFGIAEWNTIS